MTPRAADVAFVLESVEGVTAIYAIESSQRVSAFFDFAVEMEQSGRTLAETHYALLRVMTHEDCSRVFLFHTRAPHVVAKGARLLTLTPAERESARRRVPPAPPRGAIVAMPPMPPAPRPPYYASVLLVDDDAATERIVNSVLDPSAPRIVVTAIVERAVLLAANQPFDLILCDAKRAFGADGLLARLPLEVASKVLVPAARSELVDARWRLQGTARIVAKPVKRWILRERLTRAGAGVVNLLWAPDLALARVAAQEQPRRKLSTPPSSAPLTVLLADVDDDAHEALRRIFREESRHLLRHDPVVAAEVALTTPIHVILCSERAALHPRSFLDALAREDPAGADRVLVVAPCRDVSYVRHKLGLMRRKNTVLALPLDETLLGREVFRRHPQLGARVAVADLVASVAEADSAPLAPPRFRRLAVLVVDDDQTTQILSSS